MKADSENQLSVRQRCKWSEGDPLLEAYHDFEWGVPPGSDDELFERMSMQIFQAGLSWKLILKKRKGIQKAFDGFKITEVAAYNDDKFRELLNNKEIIRNKQKIKSVMQNAKSVMEIQQEFGSFFAFINILPPKLSELQSEMRKRFKFMGPEITRMFVFNIGKIPPPHDSQCWRNKD